MNLSKNRFNLTGLTLGLILLSSLGLSGCQGDTQSPAKQALNITLPEAKTETKIEMGQVLYMDFNVEPIAGYKRGDIEQQGARCQISRADFLHALHGQPQYPFVDWALKDKISFKSDMRADGQGTDSYWVDNNGIVRFDKTGAVWQLDKADFVEHLKCPFDTHDSAKNIPPRNGLH